MIPEGRYMKKFAILTLLALELVVCGCGTTPANRITTTTNGNWEARLIGGTGPASQLSFVTTFSVSNISGGTGEPLDITGFSFFNAGPCFAVGTNTSNENGSATLSVQSTGQVTGTMTYAVTSVAANNVAAGNLLTLTSLQPDGVTGTFTGSSPTTGTISNGVVVGTWTLSSGDSSCNGGSTGSISGTFVMCQGSATCTPPGAAQQAAKHD